MAVKGLIHAAYYICTFSWISQWSPGPCTPLGIMSLVDPGQLFVLGWGGGGGGGGMKM